MEGGVSGKLEINVFALFKKQVSDIKNFFENHIENTKMHLSEVEKEKIVASYNHAESPHAPITIATSSENGLFSKEDKAKLDGISENANNYIHPIKHNADIIVTDDEHNFVTNQNINNWNSIYQQSTGYTDTKIAELINGAPSTLDTLGEIAQAMQENENVVDALDKAMGSKAPQAELDGHTGNSTIHITASEREGWNKKIDYNGNASSATVTFAQASSLANISTGDKLSVIMSKVSKAIAALIAHVGAKATGNEIGHVRLSDNYSSAISNGAAANGVGASQKAVADAYAALNNSLGGLEFAQDAEGNWGYKPAGADTVTPFKESQNTIYFDTIYLISGYQGGIVFSSNVDVIVKGLTTLKIGKKDYSEVYLYDISGGNPVLITKIQGAVVIDISKYDKIRFQAKPVSETGSQISGSAISEVIMC